MMRHAMLAAALVLALVAPRGARADLWLEATLDWDCPQTENTLNVPLTKALKLRFNDTTGAVDDHEIKEFLEKVGADYPGYDFFECAHRLAESAFSKVKDVCMDNESPSGPVCKPDRTKIARHVLTALGAGAAAYGKRAREHDAIPPFEPGQAGRGALNSMQRWANMVYDCGESLSAVDLDERVLFGLPELKNMPVWTHDGAGQLVTKPEDKVSPECLKRISRAYAELLRDQNPTKGQCLANLVNCDKRRENVRKALGLLARAGLTPDPPESIADECVNTDELVRTELARMLTDKDLSSCSLGQGESRRIDGSMGSGLASKYSILRRNDAPLSAPYKAAGGATISKGTKVPSFEIVVNPHFSDRAGHEDPKLIAKYESRARECYKEASPFLRGPNGEFLEVKLSKDDPALPAPPPSPITIIGDGERSDSESWKADIECKTILHETMHLLGLVDEYKESSMGAKVDKKTGAVSYADKEADLPEQDCRALGPSDSIMSRQWEAYDHAGMDTVFFFFRSKAKRPSLLYPAQFNAITAPGCGALNSLYYACARDSQHTTLDAFGAGCRKDRPAACNSPDWVGKY